MSKTDPLVKAEPLDFQPMDETAARAILTWRYEAPYEVYSLDAGDPDEEMRCFLDPANAYHTIFDRGGFLAAYCCFGPDAQVPGGDYGATALDIGLGLHPDLTGQGLGQAFVRAVLCFAWERFAPAEFRVTVAEFNERALRVWRTARFRPAQRFERTPDGMPFVVLTRRSDVEPGAGGDDSSAER